MPLMPIACGRKRTHLFSKPAGLLAKVAVLTLVLSGISPAFAEVSPTDHAAHHPAPTMTQATPMATLGLTYVPAYAAGQYAAPSDIPKTAFATMPAPSPAASPMSGGSMGSAPGAGQMMAMMGEMGMPQPAFYPSLMAMPQVGPEQRLSLEMQSHQSISAGAALMTDGLVQLSRRTADVDAVAVRNALDQIKQGASLTEAGLSGQRVLTGEAPQQVALGWFRRQMNMPSLVEAGDQWVIYGLTPFHLTVMLALILASITLISAYVYRMGAAAQLVRRITSHMPHLPHLAHRSSTPPPAEPAVPPAQPVSSPAEPAAGAATSQAKPATMPTAPETAEVVFSKSGKTVILQPGETLYDAAERAEVAIAGSCLTGTCGGCKITVIKGDVITEGEQEAHHVEDATVLACQSHPRGKVIVRA